MDTKNNKRIAKNTIFLYFRMFFTMGINLYTSRVVLNTLGVEDFGLYNVIGGIIIMFAFLNTSMASASQRYFNFEMGKEKGNLNKTFSTSFIIHLLIALIIILLGETVGLWFLKNKMVIPNLRVDAAFWVYQFSIISLVGMILLVPFHSLIIAHEKMQAFAYISIIEVSLKLSAALTLMFISHDKLVSYALFITIISLSNLFIYRFYCKKKISHVAFTKQIDKNLFIEMLSFAGWNLVGNLAAIVYTQGTNILLNMFFGPVVNAARAIAVQVQTAINGFALNFQTALNPQITKKYASKELKGMHSLICASSKYSFYLLLLMSLPIIIETEFILVMWLKNIPVNTIIFLRIILIIIMIDAVANPLIIAAQATGKIRRYQMVVGGILLLILPFSYLALQFYEVPYIVFIVHLFFAIVAQIARLKMISKLINLSIKTYTKEVIIKIVVVGIGSSIIPLYLYSSLDPSITRFFIISITCVISTLFFVFLVGLNRFERDFLTAKIRTKLKGKI